jgi:hypothetical protein
MEQRLGEVPTNLRRSEPVPIERGFGLRRPLGRNLVLREQALYSCGDPWVVRHSGNGRGLSFGDRWILCQSDQKEITQWPCTR